MNHKKVNCDCSFEHSGCCVQTSEADISVPEVHRGVTGLLSYCRILKHR